MSCYTAVYDGKSRPANSIISTVCSEVSSSIERPAQPQEDPLLKLINKLRLALDKVYTSPGDHPVEGNSRAILKSTAKEVLKTSVYAASREGSIAPSVFGGSSQEGNEYVESWVHRLNEIEQEEILENESYSTSGQSQVYIDDDDRLETSIDSSTSWSNRGGPLKHNIRLNLARSLIRDGTRQYELGKYVQASTCFNRVLEHSSELDSESLIALDLAPVYFKLGTICFQDEDFEKAEENFRKLIADNDDGDSELILTSYLKLGEICYERNDTARNDLNNAIKYCETAANKFAERLDHPCDNYYKSTSLMAMIYIRQGYREDAEALLQTLPPQFRGHMRSQSSNSSPRPPRYSRFESDPPPRSPRRILSGIRSSVGSFDQRTFGKEYPASPDSTAIEVSSPVRKMSELSGLDSLKISTNQDPQSVLESGGFVGNFDANKALSWAVKQGSDRTVNLLLQGYQTRARKKLSTQEQLIEKKADPNGSSKNNPSPLMLAILGNQVTIARSLIHYNATLDKADSTGKTPLSVAAEHGYAEILRLFPEPVVKAACETDRRRNPLHVAALNNRTGVVQIFLEAGANPDSRDSSLGETALKHAARKGYSSIVELLLAYGANPAIADDHSNTPLMAAVRSGDMDTASYLTTFSPPCQSVLNTKNHKGETALFLAVTMNHQQEAILLLHAGAEVDRADLNGWTPLIAACDYGYADMVKILLQAGADPNVKTLKGGTPLDHSQSKRRPAVEEILRSQVPNLQNGSRLVHANARVNNPYSGYAM